MVTEEIVFWGCDRCSSSRLLCSSCIHNPVLEDNYSQIGDEDDTEDLDDLETLY